MEHWSVDDYKKFKDVDLLNERNLLTAREDGKQNILLRNLEENNLLNWQNEIRKFAVSVIKRDKQKLLNSLEDAFDQNGNNQDYFIFITMQAIW